MKKTVNLLKIILLDVLGVLLIIAAALTGWLPGPGGIPLAIAGLALLAINHEWAERWLHQLKKKVVEIKDKITSKSNK